MVQWSSLGRSTAILVITAFSAAVFTATLGAAGPGSDADSPTWSPNGAQIAFAYVDSSSFRIVAASATGSGSRRTLHAAKNTDGCCDPMAWAAGGRILYVANYTLMSLSATGGRPKRLFSSTPWFTLSPNKETAALTDGCGCGHAPDAIGLIDVRGGKPYVIPKPAKASDEIDGFSPDGTELVFTRYSSINDGVVGTTTLMAAHVGGGTPVPLTQSGLIGASQLPAGANSVRWSPDGRWIAFVRNLTLEVVSTAGGTARVLATHFGADGFSWSPNSALIAYDCCSNRPNQFLMTVDPANGHRTKLGAAHNLRYITEDSLDGPQWSPDSSKLVFMTRTGPGYPPIHIWIADVESQKLIQIA